jgi:hypothetical protein
MKSKTDFTALGIIILVLGLAACSRFLPHLPNVGVVSALGMFLGSQISWKKALGLMFLVRLVSDLWLGWFAWPLMLAVYASHAFGVLLGRFIKLGPQGNVPWARVISSSFAGAMVFFFVTNFAFLYDFYPHTTLGIFQSYINALPFLRGTLLGDLGYTVVFFGTYAMATQFVRSRQSRIVHA